MLEYIIKNNLIVFLLELGAAISGIICLRRTRNSKPIDKLFVYYLWMVVFVELVGFYPIYGYFTNYETLPFIKDTPFQYNYWWYNIYNIIKFSILFIYFLKHLKDLQARWLLTLLSIGFIFSAVINLIVTDVLFLKSSAYTFIGGTIILVLMILIYFYQLLKSNQILYFYNNISFYISIGLLIWHLTVTPLFIYNNYFSNENPVFLSLHIWLLRIVNIFLYGFLIAGFFICSERKHHKRGNIWKWKLWSTTCRFNFFLTFRKVE